MFDLGRSFVASVERSANALAVVDGDRRLSYAEWYGEVCRVIDGLAALGLRKGDHLAVGLQNRLVIATSIGRVSSPASSSCPSTGGPKPKSSIIA